MAVGSFTYGTVARVEALVGDVVASRTFATGTTPKLAQVETFLDDTAAEIHAAMAEAGYTVPTSAEATTSAPRAANWLALINTYGAAAMVLQSVPYESQAPEVSEAPNSRSGWFYKRFKEGLEKISGRFLANLGLTVGKPSSDLLVVTSYKNSDGDIKTPLFKRDTFDYPGSGTGGSVAEDDE